MSVKDACSCFRTTSRSHRAIKTNILSSFSTSSILHNHRVRGLTTETVSDARSEPVFDPDLDLKASRKPRTKKDQYYKTSAGIVLCRSPIVTRELSEFEKAFYAYQRHLKSRLSSPFPTDFYFTKGSLASKRWLAGEEQRQRATELVSEPQLTRSTGELTGQERELENEDDIAASVAVSRTTEADQKNDNKSLNRKLDRTLFLLMKKERAENSWQFPQGPVGAGEALHESSSRVLATLAGKNMKTWTVGRIPIGHLVYRFEAPQMGFEGNKVYFLKSRIFAGQCQLQKDSGVHDFGWFTKEEIKERVAPEYWKAVQSILPSQ
ncbi:50S ribosomal subunit L30 [Taphrina deformans PYCC 5710]|uniref:Large ribosomal subunit protein mL46 n=1 Tax=Taphrina deformans (strain PYCC 5710 / ATCC 11124 / CBS 356.35 / IMI 108563 / JCM 9778 / NBRC 8474) TaxID=1097556 RepID=R4X7K1_TAPDE|nr:50S ribosomal subunit L30 [Taphrina deformans PYCC 5710]|eukprot:CCG81396.1 50S ribosomal subunit L30 [Taphrina deformans PYCC 5710]